MKLLNWFRKKFPKIVYCRWDKNHSIEEPKAIEYGWKYADGYWYCSLHK